MHAYCSNKIVVLNFLQVCTNIFGLVYEELISLNQTAFINGRYILDSVTAAHEIIHNVAHSDQAGFIFKFA